MRAGASGPTIAQTVHSAYLSNQYRYSLNDNCSSAGFLPLPCQIQMSSPVRNFLGGLFGSTDSADCTLRFEFWQQEAEAEDQERTLVVESFPAHQFVLRGGSERFRAHIERWNPSKLASDDQLGGSAKRRRVLPSVDPHSSDGSQGAAQPQLSSNGNDEQMNDGDKEEPSLRVHFTSGSNACDANTQHADRRAVPELAVPLGGKEELQPSLAAIRFMYTGSLVQQGQKQQGQQDGREHQHQHGKPQQGGAQGTGLSVGELVLIRRQAEYLQVKGCEEACDLAIMHTYKTPFGGSSSSSSSSSASPLAPVLELYSFRHLLPSPEEDCRVLPVLAACREHLLRHWGAQLLPEGPEAAAQPSKVKLLVWLMGTGDAMCIANDPQLLRLWKSLPVGALEELLQSDLLSTDDEATVVLLVETWVAAKGESVTEADRGRVRRQLRLVNCSTAYLFDVLPKLRWLGPDAAQTASFLARCRLVSRVRWEQLGEGLGERDVTTPWYGEPRAQSVPEEGVSYTWEVSREELLAVLQQQGQTKTTATLYQPGSKGTKGKKSLTALGLEWELQLSYQQGEAHAGMQLDCSLPEAIRARTGGLQAASSLSAWMTVPDAREGTCTLTWEDVLLSGSARGWEDALPLDLAAPAAAHRSAAEGGAAADTVLLAPWAKLLGPAGQLSGVLTFGRLNELQAGESGGATSVNAWVELPDGDQKTHVFTMTDGVLMLGRGRGWRDALHLEVASRPDALGLQVAQPGAADGQAEGGGGAAGDDALLALWGGLLGPEGELSGVLGFHRLQE